MYLLVTAKHWRNEIKSTTTRSAQGGTPNHEQEDTFALGSNRPSLGRGGSEQGLFRVTFHIFLSFLIPRTTTHSSPYFGIIRENMLGNNLDPDRERKRESWGSSSSSSFSSRGRFTLVSGLLRQEEEAPSPLCCPGLILIY